MYTRNGRHDVLGCASVGCEISTALDRNAASTSSISATAHVKWKVRTTMQTAITASANPSTVRFIVPLLTLRGQAGGRAPRLYRYLVNRHPAVVRVRASVRQNARLSPLVNILGRAGGHSRRNGCV